MKKKRFFSVLILAGAWLAFNAGPTWSQTSPAPGKDQTKMKEGKGEKTGETKMEAKGERKKGEEEMEARGAQKPGRMGRQGAERAEAKESLGERWTKEDVKKAQEALKNKGHDPGSVDGIIGTQTRQAIRAFQKTSGLKESGGLDVETANKLGVEKTTSETSARGSTGMGKGQTSPTQKEPSSGKVK